MANKNMLFLAMAGTYNPSLITQNLRPLKFDNTNWWTRFKSRRKIKKQLKHSNVVIQATSEIFPTIKLNYQIVIPSGDVEELKWYRERPWLKPGIKFLYLPLRNKYKRIQ